MGSAFDKILVLWTLCALTTLLCGVFLGVLYHLLGQQIFVAGALHTLCLLYTSPSPRDGLLSRMPSSA